jgi:hypothetical protein
MYAHRHDWERVEAAGSLLADTALFREVAADIPRVWRYATEHNLTDASQNRQAWVGHASCCYAVGATRRETCEAWNRILTDPHRIAANRVADTVIHRFVTRQLRFTYAI